MCLCFGVFAGSSENCECDLLLIDSDGQSSQNGDHYFTRQSEIIKGQPVYYSLSGDVIWWSNDQNKRIVDIN